MSSLGLTTPFVEAAVRYQKPVAVVLATVKKLVVAVVA
jgi:hypothetical protein